MKGRHQRDRAGPVGVAWRLLAVMAAFTLACVLALVLLGAVIVFGLWLLEH